MLYRTPWSCLLIVVLMGASPPAVSAQATAAKAARPSVAAQREALGLIDEVYRDRIAAAKTPEQKAELANALLRDGLATSDDPTSRFVLMQKAMTIAGDAGDLALAMSILDKIERAYQIDAGRELNAVLKKVITTSTDPSSLFQTLNKLTDDAIANDQYTQAKEFCMAAYAVARNLRSTPFMQQAMARNREVRALDKQYAAVKAALKTLESTPTDASASLTVGRFRCFAKNDWGGLAMLAQGSDARLQQLAKRDLAGPLESAEQLALGDAWWDESSRHAGVTRQNIRIRAAEWYRSAMKNLEGLQLAKVKSRIKLLEGEQSKPAARPAAHSTTPAPPSRGKPSSVMLMDSFDAFKRNWIKGDNRGNFSFEPTAKVVSVNSPWELGGFRYGGAWTDFAFHLSVKKLSFGRFDVKINGVTLKIGPSVAKLKNGGPVLIRFDAKTNAVVAVVGGAVAGRSTVLNSNWASKLHCTFSSNGGQNAVIHIRDAQVRVP